jgi:hypothetical protein
VTVLLVVVWIGSRWRMAGYMRGSVMVQARVGCLDIAIQSRPAPQRMWGWHMLSDKAPHLQWWYSIDNDPVFKTWRGEFPVWWLAMPAAAISLTAWRLDTLASRGARLNLCPKCNYDRAGIAGDAKCPECGAMPICA